MEHRPSRVASARGREPNSGPRRGEGRARRVSPARVRLRGRAPGVARGGRAGGVPAGDQAHRARRPDARAGLSQRMGQRVFGVPRREREEGEIGLRGRGDVLPHALKRRGRGGGHHRGLGGGSLRGRGCVFRRRERRRGERAERGVRRRPPRRDGRAVFAFAHARAGRGGPVRVGGLRRFRAVQPVRPRGHVLGRARGGGARRVQARLSGRGGDSVERASRRGAQRGALRGLERLAGGDRGEGSRD